MDLYNKHSKREVVLLSLKKGTNTTKFQRKTKKTKKTTTKKDHGTRDHLIEPNILGICRKNRRPKFDLRWIPSVVILCPPVFFLLRSNKGSKRRRYDTTTSN